MEKSNKKYKGRIKVGKIYYTVMNANDWAYDLFTVNSIEENTEKGWFGAGYRDEYGAHANDFYFTGTTKYERGRIADDIRFEPALFDTLDDIKTYWHNEVEKISEMEE